MTGQVVLGCPNRTTVGLKEIRAAQQRHRLLGPNRTTVGLKGCYGAGRWSVQWQSQSHHSGIERTSHPAGQVSHSSSQSHHSGIERRLYGIALAEWQLSQSHHSGIERGKMPGWRVPGVVRPNRTTVGLKVTSVLVTQIWLALVPIAPQWD